jgi:hypothetical protein
MMNIFIFGDVGTRFEWVIEKWRPGTSLLFLPRRTAYGVHNHIHNMTSKSPLASRPTDVTKVSVDSV